MPPWCTLGSTASRFRSAAHDRLLLTSKSGEAPLVNRWLGKKAVKLIFDANFPSLRRLGPARTSLVDADYSNRLALGHSRGRTRQQRFKAERG